MKTFKKFLLCCVFIISLIFIVLFFDPYIREIILKNVGIMPFKAEIFWTFFAGVGTIIAISITAFLYFKNLNKNEIAQINAIIEELRHNLAIAKLFTDKEMPSEKEVQGIISKLDQLSDTDKYPNPDETPNHRKHDLFNVFENYDKQTFFHLASPYTHLFTFKNQAISNALISGSAFILGPRICTNLGHLEYSLKRLNLQIETHNKAPDHYPNLNKMKKEYYIWVHFRLLFTLLDILRNYPLKKIYYKNLYSEFKERAHDKW